MLTFPLLYLGHREPFEVAPMTQWLSQHWCWAGGGRVSAPWGRSQTTQGTAGELSMGSERAGWHAVCRHALLSKKENRHNWLGNLLPTWTRWPRIYLRTKKFVEVIEAIMHRCVRTRPLYTYTSGFGDLVSKLRCGFWKQKITRGRRNVHKRSGPVTVW